MHFPPTLTIISPEGDAQSAIMVLMASKGPRQTAGRAAPSSLLQSGAGHCLLASSVAQSQPPPPSTSWTTDAATGGPDSALASSRLPHGHEGHLIGTQRLAPDVVEADQEQIFA